MRALSKEFSLNVDLSAMGNTAIGKRIKAAAVATGVTTDKKSGDRVCMTQHPFDLPTRFIITLYALNYGFFKIAGTESDIPCEMLLYFTYYRLCVMLGMWVQFGIQEGIWIAVSVIQMAFSVRLVPSIFSVTWMRARPSEDHVVDTWRHKLMMLGEVTIFVAQVCACVRARSHKAPGPIASQ